MKGTRFVHLFFASINANYEKISYVRLFRKTFFFKKKFSYLFSVEIVFRIVEPRVELLYRV